MKLKDLKGFPKEKEFTEELAEDLYKQLRLEGKSIFAKIRNHTLSEIGEMKLVWDRRRLLTLITGVGGFDGDTEHEILERIIKEFPIKEFPIKVKE